MRSRRKQDIDQRILEYLDNRLSGEALRQVEAKIRTQPDWKERWSFYQSIEQALVQKSEVNAPYYFEEKVMQRLEGIPSTSTPLREKLNLRLPLFYVLSYVLTGIILLLLAWNQSSEWANGGKDESFWMSWMSWLGSTSIQRLFVVAFALFILLNVDHFLQRRRQGSSARPV